MATFEATVWQWDARKSDAWYFVTLPDELSDDIEAEHGRHAAGFGSIRVEVTIGTSTWRTSIFPDSTTKSYVLPLKKAIRVKQGLAAGRPATVGLTVLA